MILLRQRNYSRADYAGLNPIEKIKLRKRRNQIAKGAKELLKGRDRAIDELAQDLAAENWPAPYSSWHDANIKAFRKEARGTISKISDAAAKDAKKQIQENTKKLKKTAGKVGVAGAAVLGTGVAINELMKKKKKKNDDQ